MPHPPGPVVRRSDFLTALLLTRDRLTPLQFGLVGLGVEATTKVGQVAYGLATHVLPIHWCFIIWGDWDVFTANMLQSFLIVPAIWVLRGWIARAVPAVLHDLDQQGLFPGRRDGAATVWAAHRRLITSSWWPILAAGVSLACAFAWIRVFWTSERGFLAIQLASWLLTWYLLTIAVIEELQLIVLLHSYFRSPDLELHPLHPDRCGGLGPLNRHALVFSYFIGVCAFGLGLLTFLSIHEGRFPYEYTLHAGIALYVIGAPCLFFATLGSAHQAMLSARTHLLGRIGAQFQTVYHALQASLSDAPGPLHSHVEHLEVLKKLYRTTERFPVWPFDWSHLRRFGLSVGSPILGVALPQIVNLVPLLHTWLGLPLPGH
jgi:hypothetical protein